MRRLFIVFFIVALISCNNKEKTKEQGNMYTKTGSVERLDPALDSIIESNALPEIIAEGFEWSEGPLWIPTQDMLLFSDVPKNTIYKWTEGKGSEIYLNPSGYTGDQPSQAKEPGSNGLVLDPQGKLVLCQHGNRQMARMDAPLDKPAPKYITLAGNYQGKKFSSPNDATFSKMGELFFTDPPYGLTSQNDNDPQKEIPFNGIYKIKTNGDVILLADTITRPNGIALFPDEKRLLVANSDPDLPNWYVWDINGDTLNNGRIFYSAAGYDKVLKGLPDGLKIDSKGNVFATGPGGIYFFNSDGKLLGRLKLDHPASNCALSPDEKTLYITNDMYLLRLKLRN